MCQKNNFDLIEQHDLGRDTFYTTPLFWDCECEEDFIHPASENECLRCSSQREHQPDARVDEVLRYAAGLPWGLVQIVENLAEQFAPELTAIPF
jgi:hypothetical protein